MDIRSAYSAALSSLNATQYESSITSTNIANANVQGYSAQRVNTATRFSDGYAVGVGVSSVSSYVNENLYKSYVSATSDSSACAVISENLSLLLDQYGSVDSGTTLSDLVTDLQNSLADLALTPESQTAKSAVLDDADVLADKLNSLSKDIQQQRENVDGDIENAVNEVNQALSTIDELNREIALKTALGENTSTLEDARNQALLSVSQNMDVSYFTTSSNELHVYTSGGLPLVDSQAHDLSYSSSNNVSSGTSFNAVTLEGRDVSSQLKGGAIGAMFELRDDILPSQQDELDELASVLSETLNSVLNQGSAFAPPNAITGQTVVAGTDALSATGTFRLVLSDEDGQAQSVTDLDLSTYATVDDLVLALDAISGISAEITADGQLSLRADDAALGVALSEMDSSVAPDAQGVSDYFGLNDLFVGRDAATISVRADLLEDASLLATGKVSQDAGLSAGDTVLTSGDASLSLALQEAMSASYSFDAAGDLSATTSSLGDYASEILSNLALKADKAETSATTQAAIAENLALDITNESGVNLDEEAARLTVLENQYSASAQIIQTLNDMFSSLLNAVA